MNKLFLAAVCAVSWLGGSAALADGRVAELRTAAELRAAFADPASTVGDLRRALDRTEGIVSIGLARALTESLELLDERTERARDELRSAYRARSRANARRLREEVRSQLELHDAVFERLASQRDSAVLEWLLEHVVTNERAHPPARVAAARALTAGGVRDADEARALLDTFRKLEARSQPIESRRHAAIRRGDEDPVAGLRRDLDPLRAVQDAILAALRAVEDRALLAWLFETVALDEDAPLSLRATVVRRAAAAGDLSASHLTGVLVSAREPSLLVLLLLALARVGSDGRAAADRVLELLAHDDTTVRERAAFALAAMAPPQAIEPLIERLEVERGRTRRHMAAALEIITRQRLGLSVSAWRAWFDDHGATFTSGAVPLGGGETSFEAHLNQGYYFGIPQEGHSIVYVIDVSGSMLESVEGGRRRYRRARGGTATRMAASKEELRRALASLPDGTLFNIVHYSDVAHLYSKSMVKASPERIEAARRFVSRLQADGATNIYDALERAFQLAGHGRRDRYYDARVETVFLLTDGKPQLPDGTLDDTARIREAVRRWNPLDKIVVHTIGIGKGINVPFLQALASENQGRFVQR